MVRPDIRGATGGCLDPDASEQAEAYAAGTLDTAERAAFERHLAGCPSCRSQVQRYMDVLAAFPGALAVASPALRPPSALRRRVLDAIAVGAAEPARTALRPVHSRRRVRVAGRPMIAAIAAAGVLALGAGWGVQRGVALARAQAQLRAEYAALIGQQEIVLDVVDARNTVKRNLAPPAPVADPSAAPYGKLYTRPDVPQVVAMAGRLPAPPAGQAYHLWVTERGQTRLAGTLAFNQGFGLLVFDADHAGPAYDAAWMTLQPLGSATPISTTVLRWQA
jgi:hypothetical protein